MESRDSVQTNEKQGQAVQDPRVNDDDGLPIPSKVIFESYRRMENDVHSREDELTGELPVEDSTGLKRALREQRHRWETGRKSLRSVPVLNAYETVVDESVVSKRSLVRVLLGLDTTINVLDDIIDTPGAGSSLRLQHTINLAFAQTLTIGEVPAEHRDEVGDMLRQYLTEIFQIPTVETRLLNSLEQTPHSDIERRLELATAIQEWRGNGISAFARLPTYYLKEPPVDVESIIADLRALRARQLLYKDIADVERDLEDDDPTIVTVLLQDPGVSIPEAVEFLEAIHNQFSYVAPGGDRYREILTTLERKPGELETALDDAATSIESK
jgi:hypothetical protein